jgi:hypothetical protein
MGKSRKNTIVIGIVILVFLGGLTYQHFQTKKLVENLEQTSGVVTDFSFSNNTYYLDYVFTVNGIQFKGTASCHYFKCDDGTEGCVGKNVTVFYSPDDPTNNEIDLGKYNKFKYTHFSIL